jgi:hypothetical protein
MGKLALTGNSRTRKRYAELSGVAAFVPTDIAGCAAWWDASDTATITAAPTDVTAWSDKSGNGRNLTNNGGLGPETGTLTVNGRNVLKYITASSRQMGSNSAFVYGLGDATIFVVAKDDTNGAFVAEGRSGSNNGSYFVANQVTTKVARFYHETDAGSTLFDRTTTTSTATGIRITTVDTTTNAKITDSGGGTSNVNYTRGTFTPDRLGIGCLRRVGSALHVNGWIAEIIIYNTALSAGNITLVETYLNTKWGF